MNAQVNKNGEAEWFLVQNALTLKDAVETYFNVKVYLYKIAGPYIIFDDIRDSVDQLYAAITHSDDEPF